MNIHSILLRSAGVLTLLFSLPSLHSQALYACRDGYVYWISDAPLELIEAESDNLQGVIKEADRTFAFSLSIRSFDGFNNGLQQEHFHENYLETEEYSKALFSGKILDAVDFSQPGIQTVRAKGMLEVHGIRQERIIKTTLNIKADGSMTISSDFTIILADHDIRIPRIVFQKIAEEIRVRVRATLNTDTP